MGVFPVGGPPRSRVQDTELVASTAEALPEELGMASTQRGADPGVRVPGTGLSGYLQAQSVRLAVSL